MPVDLLASLDISLVEEHMLRAFYCYLNQVVKTIEKRFSSRVWYMQRHGSRTHEKSAHWGDGVALGG